MNHQPDSRESAGPDLSMDDEYQPPGLADAIRFLYQRRVKLVFHALAIFILGSLAFAHFFFTSPKIVEGMIGLTFRGIEKSEYPSGKRFSIEDFRSSTVLTKALADVGIPAERVSSRDLSARLYITPVIPGEIRGRWNKQEQTGEKREEYSPSEFHVAIEISVLTDEQRLRLFDSVVKHYQETVKYDQKSAKGFIYSADTDYDKLAGSYDFWDIPGLLRETYKSLNRKLNNLIAESMQYTDASYQLSFRGIDKDLDNWERTRLEALEAVTYQGRLVKNKDIVAERIQYRMQDLDIQIRLKSQQAAEGIRLLEVINQPKGLVAGSTRQGLPVLDDNTLQKLVDSDYVGPVVERVSDLQTEVRAMEADKARLEKQLSWLPNSPGSSPALPAGYKELTTTVSKELDGIVQKYDRLLDEYLGTTISSLVMVKQAPFVARETLSPALALAGIAFLSIFVAIVLLGIEHLFSKAKKEEQQAKAAAHQRAVR